MKHNVSQIIYLVPTFVFGEKKLFSKLFLNQLCINFQFVLSDNAMFLAGPNFLFSPAHRNLFLLSDVFVTYFEAFQQ